MFYELLIFLAIIPIYLICKYIYNKDHNKETGYILRQLFVGGILSVIIVVIISKFNSAVFPFFAVDRKTLSGVALLARITLGVGIVEEFAKWIIVYVIAYRSIEFDEKYDGIVYAVFVSLGFAAIENILYVFGGGSALGGIIIAGMRAVSAVPVHACFAIIMGSYISLAKTCSQKGYKLEEIANLIISVLLPGIVHGVYDYALETASIRSLIVILACVVILYVICIHKVNKISTNKELV